jgi:hypothetical protein
MINPYNETLNEKGSYQAWIGLSELVPVGDITDSR